MPALNFKPQFAERVRMGFKTQTIRKPRKRPIKCGDKLYLYRGMRTKACECLGVGRCRAVLPIRIRHEGYDLGFGNAVSVGHLADCNDFAKADGFASWEELVAWFDEVHGLPFSGELITWELIRDERTYQKVAMLIAEALAQ